MERPTSFSGRGLRRDFSIQYVVNGLVALVFAATGPLAVILSVGLTGGLTQTQIASWIFAAFGVNGVLTVLASLLYRQPLGFLWTIPGTVLVGPALLRYDWLEIVGAFCVTGALICVLGLTGGMRKAFTIVPMSVVMGMVAGVFLSFGTELVLAVTNDPTIGVVMSVVFFMWFFGTRPMNRIPPTLMALIVGFGVVLATGRFSPNELGSSWVVEPGLYVPSWSVGAMVELVIPLAVTVLFVQNGQGIAVLRAAGHDPPINFITLGCGAWSLIVAPLGSVSTCLTGPANAILVSSGTPARHYVAGLSLGGFAIAFGLFSPLFSEILMGVPPEFVATLAGLAMLPVLNMAFRSTFGGDFSLGGLVAFLVTVADISVLNISGAFWGLLVGIGIAAVEKRRTVPS